MPGMSTCKIRKYGLVYTQVAQAYYKSFINMRDIILRNSQNAGKHKVFVWEFRQ